MANYRYAYEEYYKNINKQGNKNYYSLGKKNNAIVNTRINEIKYFTAKYWTKKIIIQLIGSFSILTFFIGLKYIKIDNVQNAYAWCKGCISEQVTYEDIKEINVENFNIENLKFESVKQHAEKFIESFKEEFKK